MTYLYKKIKSFFYRLSRNGKHGERKTHAEAKRLRMHKKVVSSVYCVKNNPMPTEIDSIILTKYGWIVIETKHLTGALTGKSHDEQWTLTTRNHKRRMHNPILQNQTHILALNHSLPHYSNIPKYSMIVFDEAVSWEAKSNTTLLLHRKDMNEHVGKLLKNKRQVSTMSDLRVMAKELRTMRKISRKHKKKHIRHVQKKQKLGNRS